MLSHSLTRWLSIFCVLMEVKNYLKKEINTVSKRKRSGIELGKNVDIRRPE